MEKIKTLNTKEGAENYIKRMGLVGKATVVKCLDSVAYDVMPYEKIENKLEEVKHEYMNDVILRIQDYDKLKKFVSYLLEKNVIEVNYFGVEISREFKDKVRDVLTEKAKKVMIQKSLEEFKITDLKLKATVVIHENITYKDPDFDKFFECVKDDETLLECLFDIGLMEMTDYGISTDYKFMSQISDCIKYTVMSKDELLEDTEANYTVKSLTFDKNLMDDVILDLNNKIVKSIKDSPTVVGFYEENKIDIMNDTLLKSLDSKYLYIYSSTNNKLIDGWGEQITLKDTEALLLEDSDSNKLIFTENGIFAAEKADY